MGRVGRAPQFLSAVSRLALFAGLVGGVAGQGARALDPRVATSQYRFERWSKAQGLPQSSANAMAEDCDGFLWIASQEGLSRFDGLSFRNFLVEDTPELGNNYVSALYVDPHGVLWVGTEQGRLSRYAGGRFSRVDSGAGYLGMVVAMATDSRGALLVAFERGGLKWLGKGDRLQPVLDRQGRSIERAEALSRAPDGAIWVAGEGALWRESAGALDRYPLPLPADTRVTALAFRREGEIWVATENAGLLDLELRDGALRRRGKPLAVSDTMHTLVVDSAGTLWAGGIGGLGRVLLGPGPPRFERFAGAELGVVDSLFEARNGGLWVGTRGGGIVRLGEGEAVPIGAPEGLPDDATWNTRETRDGAIWITTDRGMARWIGGRVEKVSIPGFPSPDAEALLEARDGAVWVGTYGHGIYRLPQAGSPLQHFDRSDGLPPGPVTVLFEDSAGTLWVGSRDGLSRRPPGGGFTPVRLLSGPVQAYVTSIAEDAAHRVWIATVEGLFSLPAGGEGVAASVPELARAVLNALHVDPQGRIWIATNERGVAVLDRGRVLWLDPARGFPFSLVIWIVDDARGDLWFSTNHGILRARPADLLAAARGERQDLDFRLIGVGDGMRDEECAGTGQPAGWRARDGRLWFPTGLGVVVIDPQALLPPVPPRARIDSVGIDGAPSRAVMAKGLSLPPGKGELEIHYIALGSDEPGGTTFRYRLSGSDEEWVEAGARRIAYYTHLSPGRYRFEVEARHQDGGPWSAPAVLDLRLAPHLSETWTFRGLAALAAILAALGLVRWRNRYLQGLIARRTEELSAVNRDLAVSLARQADLRERAEQASEAKGRFLATVSHELRTPLNAILGFSEMLRESPLTPRQREFATLVHESGESLLRLVDEILDLTRAEGGALALADRPFSLPAELEAAVDLVAAAASSKGLELALAIEPAAARPVCGDGARLRQAVLNLLANAVKFTPRGAVAAWVEAAEEPGPEEGEGWLRIRIEVADSGIGIAREEQGRIFEPFHQVDSGTKRTYGGSGLGLAIVQRLIAAMGGTVEVESEPGSGSTFTVGFRLRLTPGKAAEGPLWLAGRTFRLAGFSPLTERVLTRQLRSWGAEIASPAATADGGGALAGPGPVADAGVVAGPLTPELAQEARGWVRLIPLGEPDDSPPGEVRLQWPLTPSKMARALDRLFRGGSVQGGDVLTVEAPELPVFSGRGLRLLVVEDNEVNQAVILAMVGALGIDARVCGSGDEALAELERAPFDLVLLDIQMPGMDGFEVMRRMEVRFGDARPRVVALTASAMAEDRERCLAAGMDGYLSKPVRLEDLAAAIARLAPVRPEYNPLFER